MKPSRLIGSLCLASFVSLFPAKWGNTAVEQLCLSLIPDWADKAIYSTLRPLLSEDIGNAAEQMDFIEVWFTSFLMMAAVMFTLLLAYKMKCRNSTSRQEVDSA